MFFFFVRKITRAPRYRLCIFKNIYVGGGELKTNILDFAIIKKKKL